MTQFCPRTGYQSQKGPNLHFFVLIPRSLLTPSDSQQGLAAHGMPNCCRSLSVAEGFSDSRSVFMGVS
jgi:hypothetical protein